MQARGSVSRFTVLALAISLPTSVARGQTAEAEKAKSREDERQRRQLAEQEANVRRTLDQIILRAEESASLLKRLTERAEGHNARAQLLLTNDDGKRVAQDPIAFMAILPFYEDPSVDLHEIRGRTQSIQDILTSLAAEREKPSVGFVPSEKVQDDINGNYYWAKDRLAFLATRESNLSSVIERAPKLSDPKSAKTLDERIKDYQAARLSLFGKWRAAGEEQAKPESERKIMESSRVAELERANAEAERLLREARAEIERMKVERDIEFARQDAEIKRRLAEAETRYRDLMAELERMQKEADAVRHAENVDATIKSGRIVSEAEKKRLREKCRDPEVKRVLAPFLDLGVFRPSGNMHGSKRYDSIKPVPISFSDLEKLGALSPTASGCTMLHKIASVPTDTMRTRWPGYRKKWQDDADLRELVPRAQELLIELGPTLVEEEMLQP